MELTSIIYSPQVQRQFWIFEYYLHFGYTSMKIHFGPVVTTFPGTPNGVFKDLYQIQKGYLLDWERSPINHTRRPSRDREKAQHTGFHLNKHFSRFSVRFSFLFPEKRSTVSPDTDPGHILRSRALNGFILPFPLTKDVLKRPICPFFRACWPHFPQWINSTASPYFEFFGFPSLPIYDDENLRFFLH